MLNIVIPMAGRGSRFQRVGYPMPKPLIPVGGKLMVERVIDNLRPGSPHRFIFICQKQHLRDFPLEEHLRAATADPVIVALDGITEGAACTVLMAREFIDSEEALMIANCDQFVDTAIDEYLGAMEVGRLDGLIMTMTADHPKWSFVALDSNQLVTRVVEKQVISDEATVGIYNFRHGHDFVAGAEAMIARNERVNNEFYVAPVYNDLIAAGHRVGIYNVGSEANGMYGLGIPEDLDLFLTPEIQDRLKHRL
jgi:dTDP-glucose pyrophosphorylase